MARVLEEKALGTLRNQAHVAMSVHHSEGFAVLERPEGPTDERGLCLDVMLWDGLRRRGPRQFRLSDTFVQRSTPVAAVISECQLGCRKPLLEVRPYGGAVESSDCLYGLHRFVDTVDNNPRNSVVDDLRNRPARPGDYRRSHSHRFD